MANFLDLVKTFERHFKCYGQTFKQTMSPEVGFKQLLTALKKAEAEKILDEVSVFYKSLPKTPGGIVPVSSLKQLEAYIANPPVRNFSPNDGVIRDLKLRCLRLMDAF